MVAPDDPRWLEARLRACLATRDLAGFGTLLADDVRWGDDTHPRRCRGRAQVVARFAELMSSGVTADVVETATGPAGVMCRMHVHWPEPADRRRGVEFFHLYLVDAAGRVGELRRYNDERSAREALACG